MKWKQQQRQLTIADNEEGDLTLLLLFPFLYSSQLAITNYYYVSSIHPLGLYLLNPRQGRL